MMNTIQDTDVMVRPSGKPAVKGALYVQSARTACGTGLVSAISVRRGACRPASPVVNAGTVEVPASGMGLTRATTPYGYAQLRECPLCERLALALMVASSALAIGSSLLQSAGLLHHWPGFVKWAETVLAMG